MFSDDKNSQNAIHDDMFGIGSIIKAGWDEWLVIPLEDKISLYNIEKNEISTLPPISVENVSFLSSSEARQLVLLANNNYTYSDFEFDSKGHKNLMVINNEPKMKKIKFSQPKIKVSNH